VKDFGVEFSHLVSHEVFHRIAICTVYAEPCAGSSTFCERDLLPLVWLQLSALIQTVKQNCEIHLPKSEVTGGFIKGIDENRPELITRCIEDAEQVDGK